MEEFYVRKEPLTDWLQQKICVLLQCKYCWYVWGIWGQQRGSELALLLCHHFVFWTGKIILLSIFSPIFLSKLQEFKACNKEREKLWIYVSNMAVWKKKSASIHLFLCLRKFTKQHICSPLFLFFFSNQICAFRRLSWFGMFLPCRSFGRKLVLKKKKVLTTGFKMEQLGGNGAACTLISVPACWYRTVTFWRERNLVRWEHGGGSFFWVSSS